MRRFPPIFACIVFALLLLSGCSERIAKTAGRFTQIMEDAGFTVRDTTEESERGEQITSVLTADGDQYQVTFFQLNDSDACETFFSEEKERLDKEHNAKWLSVKTGSTNYDSYVFNSGDTCYFIARIGDTMVSCKADKEYRSELLELMKTLGYK